ncbi:MAG: DUF1905 domain-containing protein [Anaerolineae bacterium]|nr:DUF1905 domain-containing protein [Anaerolineae bacterium]
MPRKHEFDAPLAKGGEAANAGYFVEVPPEVVADFGKKGQVKVKAEVDGYAYRTSIAPYGGAYYLGVRKEIRAAIGKLNGGLVHVTLEVDAEPRVVEIPPDFAAAMSMETRTAFDKLSFSHQKEYVDWIVEAKRAETRQRRIDKALEMIAGGTKTPRA